MSDNDTDLISAASALVSTSNKVNAETVNTKNNVIIDNKKNPIDVINNILKSISDTAEKNSEALIKSNYDALDKVISNKLKLPIKEISNISTSDKKEVKVDKNITTNKPKESASIKVLDREVLSNKVLDKPKEFVPNKVLDKPKEFITNKELDKNYATSSSSNETQFYTRIFTLLGKSLGIGKFAEGPEAQRLQTDLKESKIKEVTKGSISLPTVVDKKDNKASFKDMLMDLGLGLLAKDLMSGDFRSIARGVYQTIKRSIGSAIKAIKNVSKIISTNLNVLKNSITSSKIYQTIKGTLKSIGQRIGKQFSSVYESISNTFKGIQKTASTAAPALTKTQAAVSPAAASITKAPAAVAPIASSSGGIFGSIKNGFTAAKNAVGNVVGSAKSLGKRAISTVGSVTIKPVINAIKDAIKVAGGTLGFLSKFSKVLMPIAKKIPIVGSLLELFFAKGDIALYKEEREQGKIQTDQELYKKAGDRVLEGIGGVIGGAAGATLGTFIGGPVGTFFGGFVGDKAGRYASQFASYIIPESTISDVGKAVVTGTLLPSGDTGEMQDFIIKNNQVYKFSNKDEILGMKDGGAVKQLLSSTSQNNDTQLFIANKQVSILEQIRDGIIILTKSTPSNRSINIMPSNNIPAKTIPSQTFLRGDFNAAHNLQPI